MISAGSSPCRLHSLRFTCNAVHPAFHLQVQALPVMIPSRPLRTAPVHRGNQHGADDGTKSFPLAGPRLSSISSICRCGRPISFMIISPPMYSSASARIFLPGRQITVPPPVQNRVFKMVGYAHNVAGSLDAVVVGEIEDGILIEFGDHIYFAVAAAAATCWRKAYPSR